MKLILVLVSTALALTAPTSAAGKTQESAAKPAAFEALVRCRSIADSAARLACFDAAAATLEEAANKRELLLVDRQQARETKRGLFGLNLPNLGIFDGGDDDKDEIKSIESTVTRAEMFGGAWVVSLADGSVWRQTDGNVLAIPPRSGHKVKVSKAALGSYMMRVNNQPALRVKRQL